MFFKDSEIKKHKDFKIVMSILRKKHTIFKNIMSNFLLWIFKKVVKMAKKRTTIHIDEEIWELAKLKAETKHKSLSNVIENFLIDYIGNNYFIDEYVKEIRKSRQIIENEQIKIKQYNKSIQDLNDEMERNGKNELIIGECLERIKRFYSEEHIITLKFLKNLSRAKKVNVDKLKEICKNHDFLIDEN